LYSNSTIGNALVVNYQISTNTNSFNTNSTTGSKQIVNYRICINPNSFCISSTTGNKLVVNYQISTSTNSFNTNPTTGNKLVVNYTLGRKRIAKRKAFSKWMQITAQIYPTQCYAIQKVAFCEVDLRGKPVLHIYIYKY